MKKIMYYLIFAYMLIVAINNQAFAQIAADDPMIKITSLPLKINVNKIIPEISDEVARATGIAKTNITYYWQTFDTIYCPAAKDPSNTNIIFVDLYVPGFLTDKDIALLLTSLSDSLEKHTGVSKEFIFIQTHFPKEGHVYISGKIAKWSDFKSSDTKETEIKIKK